MEWLRCNKCYKLMEKLQRTFLMTECGHIFCDVCLFEAPKCNVCGRENFRTVPLARPPKFETLLNYFSPATDFARQIKKAMEFHDEQLAISMRACEEIKKKYEYGKRKYAELMKEMETQYSAYKEMVAKATKLEEAIQAYEKKFTEKPNVSMNVEMDSRDTSQSFGTHTRHSSSGQIDTRGSQNKVDRKSLMQPNLEYAHKPGSGIFEASFAPPESNHEADSGCRTMVTGGTPAVKRDGDFVVPTTQYVPRSVASIRRKARTLPRLSAPKNGYDF